ncbi:related to multidrug resistant protein [Fusarium oxysporum]|uniref:Related to multidrug resistant protein n=1 Tax=Fusarium oxysporum TaxID=5507 RepID=A0A2H3SKD2_FUSOX|nr:related to multidrug resistant protein [Fusarium oxysporum]
MDQSSSNSTLGRSTSTPDNCTSNGDRRPSTTLQTQVHRIRSQNGYGVCDGTNQVDDDSNEYSEKDPFEVGWDAGHSDPLCPRGFSTSRKWLVVTCTSSIYTSTYAQMENEFGNSRIISILGLSTFVLGLAFGPMLFSPLSEFYGRRPIYLVAWIMFIIFIVPAAVARNIWAVIVARFLDGFSGSAFLAVSGGTVSDLFTREEIHAPMALFSVAPFLGPAIGPTLGGFINYNVNWRWTYYTLLIWSVVLGIAMVLTVPETHHSAILKKKAQHIRKTTGDTRWYTPTENSDKTLSKAIGYSLLRPFQLLFFEPMCLSLCLYSAILLGILYLFFGAFSLVFSMTYGFELWQIGLSFLGIGLGLILGIATNPIWHRVHLRLERRAEMKTGITGVNEPEFHLPSAITGAVLVPIGLFWFAWSIFPSVHWFVPIIGSAIFGMGLILLFTGIFTFLVDAYSKFAASALAANTFVRCIFAGEVSSTRLSIVWKSDVSASQLPLGYIAV